ncbi:MAG: hypothetical protein KAT68_18945 [Bacteroidales bacterium]|nr:hypothetical protein [Bacteroidales bacterium]
MTDDEEINEEINEESQDEIQEAPEDRPVFDPEMIIENAAEEDINIPEDDLNDYLEKSDDG